MQAVRAAESLGRDDSALEVESYSVFCYLSKLHHDVVLNAHISLQDARNKVKRLRESAKKERAEVPLNILVLPSCWFQLIAILEGDRSFSRSCEGAVRSIRGSGNCLNIPFLCPAHSNSNPKLSPQAALEQEEANASKEGVVIDSKVLS